MYLISCLRVAFNRIAARMLKFPTPFSLVGPDSLLALCRTIVHTGAQCVLFITDGAANGGGTGLGAQEGFGLTITNEEPT